LLGVRVADRPQVIDVKLHQLCRPRRLALLFQCQAKVPACPSLPGSVANLAGDDELLLIERDGLVRVA
jgi:hypothetical protein